MSWTKPAIQSFNSLADFPNTGTKGVWYLALDSTTPYLWDGTAYVASSMGELIASAITNDSDVTGASVKDALNTLLLDIQNIPPGLTWKGTWNADTNTPEIISGAGENGWYYRVEVPGTTEIDGISDWGKNDWIIFNGTKWQKIDNSDSVTSVAGRIGDVELDTDDIENKSGVSGSTTTNALDTLNSEKVDLSEKGAPLGVAELDSTTRLKKEQIPLDVLFYKGAFDPDMFEWLVANFTSDNTPFRAVKSSDIIVAAGADGLITTSTNGKDWAVNYFGTDHMSGIAYSSDLELFAVARRSSPDSVIVSPDGINWTAYTDTSGFSGLIIDMCYGGGKFVGVGVLGVVISSDGINWSWHTVMSPFMIAIGVTYAVDRYVAVGDSGQVLVSFDGLTWVAKPSFADTATNVVYANNRLVACCENGSIYFSDDLGDSWTEVVIDATDSMKGIAFGRNKFIVCGKLTSYTSLDGINWEHLPMDPDSEGNPNNYYEHTLYGDELYPGFMAFGRYKNGGVTKGRIIYLDDAETGRVYEVTEDAEFEGFHLKKNNLIMATAGGWIVFNPQNVERYTKSGLITEAILLSKEIELEHNPQGSVSLDIQGFSIQLDGVTYTIDGNKVMLDDSLIEILQEGDPYRVTYWRRP